MAKLYSFFQHDSEEVQREWLKFTQKVLSHASVTDTVHLHGVADHLKLNCSASHHVLLAD